jgi:hypothetical protein
MIDPHDRFVDSVMILWSRKHNTAEMAKLLNAKECACSRALAIGRERRREYRLVEKPMHIE